MRIRHALEHDMSSITRIENRAIRESIAHFGTTEVAEDEIAGLWARTRDRHPWLVAELPCADDDGTPAPGSTAGCRSWAFAGYARSGPWKPREAYSRTAEISVYIESDMQRQGVGRSLYERLFDELARRGYYTLLAGITLPNPASVGLHEAMGMSHVGTLPEVGYKFERWLSVGYWAIHLPRPSPGPGPRDPVEGSERNDRPPAS